MRLPGKIAVVTGGGSGIGRATCELFDREGATVVVVDRDGGNADKVAGSLKSGLAVACDVGDESGIQELATTVAERVGRLDILINNAGVRHYGTVLDATREDWDTIFSVNLRGAALCSKHLLPLMAGSDEPGGAVVNVSSVHAWSGRPGMALYDSMKAGLLGLTRSMACDHAHENIRVNAVLPGQTLTEYHLKRAEREGQTIDDSVLRAHEGGPALLRRQARPEEIATANLFLASDEASYITGAVLAVDGGHSAMTQAN